MPSNYTKNIGTFLFLFLFLFYFILFLNILYTYNQVMDQKFEMGKYLVN
jgi:hypothetical protein